MQQTESVSARVQKVLAEVSDSDSKAIFHYWTKKSSGIAAAIVSNFLPTGGVLLDPFLGSGSTLLGFREVGAVGMMVGIDVNQLPIAISDLQVDDSIHHRLSTARSRIEEFSEVHNPYKAIEAASETGLKYSSAVLDLDGDLPRVISLRFGLTRNRLIEIDQSTPSFAKVNEAFLETWRQNSGPFPRDRALITNSRLAAKEGTTISSLFSPMSYRFLLEFSDNFRDDADVLLVLASCLHHCKFTDKGMQSQFPFWFPKRGAIDRSVTTAVVRKSSELVRSVAQEQIPKSTLFKAARFNEEVAYQHPRFLLIEKGVQDVTNVEIPDASVDLVITDPPYFDQVAYSEYLSLWEFFVGLRVNLEKEIVESNRKHDTRSRERYLSDMKLAFANIRRMIKDDGLMFIYFKDSKPQNVADFVDVLRGSGFKYLAQKHLAGTRRTYKQNSSPESTVSGDCIMVFTTTQKAQVWQENGLGSEIVVPAKEIRAQVCRYLKENGASSLGELYDNVLIPELIRRGCLQKFRTQRDIFALLEGIKRGEDLRYEA